jgi:hypothetical protein
MNKETKIYEFSIVPSGGANSIEFGEGTLEEGKKLIQQLDRELEEWFDNPNRNFNAYFKFPKPYNKVPIKWAEGSDIIAWHEETKELVDEEEFSPRHFLTLEELAEKEVSDE